MVQKILQPGNSRGQGRGYENQYWLFGNGEFSNFSNSMSVLLVLNSFENNE